MKGYGKVWPIRGFALVMVILLLFILLIPTGSLAQDHPQNQYFLWTRGVDEQQYFLVNAPNREYSEENTSFIAYLGSNTTLTFTHMQPGRYFQPDIIPEINIWFNVRGDFEQQVHFSLEFDADTDQQTELTYDFPSYTIEGDILNRPVWESELATLQPSGHSGSPVDMSDPEIGGRIIFKIWRNDTQDDEEVRVLCGYQERDSWITIPYLSTPVGEGRDDDGVPWGYIAIVVVVLLAISGLLIIGKHSTTSKPDPEELRKARKRSKKKGRRRKKGGKGKKG